MILKGLGNGTWLRSEKPTEDALSHSRPLRSADVTVGYSETGSLRHLDAAAGVLMIDGVPHCERRPERLYLIKTPLVLPYRSTRTLPSCSSQAGPASSSAPAVRWRRTTRRACLWWSTRRAVPTHHGPARRRRRWSRARRSLSSPSATTGAAPSGRPRRAGGPTSRASSATCATRAPRTSGAASDASWA